MRRLLTYGLYCLAVLTLVSGCFMGSTILFLEKDAIGKPNMLANPGFAKDPKLEQTMPHGWLLMGADQASGTEVSCDNMQSIVGENSLKIEKSTRHLMIVSDSFNINHQGGYFVKASAKSSSEKGPKLKLRFIAYNQSGAIRNTFSANLKTTQSWKKATISAGFLKQNVHFGRVIILVPPTGEDTVWLDDLGCFQVHHFGIR